MNWKKANRKIHYWGALACAIPIIIVVVTGVLLLLKKDFNWIQPSTIKGQGGSPSISFKQVLENLNSHSVLKRALEDELNKELGSISWNDIKRIDVRPSKGVMKIQLQEQVEVQMDHQSGQILQIKIRRSDVIESIHDGSYFSDFTKYWVFLPSAILLFALWVTGIYLFIITELAKFRSRRKQKTKLINTPETAQQTQHYL